jgi:hypothetical protein
MDKKSLNDIFQDDAFGILDVKPSSAPKNENDRLVESFQEIVEFYKKNNKEPQAGDSVYESSLYYRLNGIKENKDKIGSLQQYDVYGLLLKPIDKEIITINDIFKNDTLGILEGEADDIFTLKNVPKVTNMPDYIGSRKPCKNFNEYEPLFKQCHSEIVDKKRRILPFKYEQQINKGYFFILKGILLYVESVGERVLDKGKFNARLRCIFENGTESDMLLRSLAAELYKNGRRVTELNDKMMDELSNISPEDEETGYIYVLKSKSKDPKIQSIDNLYKIGYSKTPVEERILKAEQEPTYLMAAVSIVATYRCFNMNPQKMEQLLHNFFGSSCLNVDVHDREGKRHTPREWFIAPLPIIEQAIELIITGEIVGFKYNANKQEIIGL